MANPLEWENKNALLVQGSVAVSNEIKTVPGGVPKWIIENTPNDNDKEIVVPANKIWILKGAYVEFNSTAVVGNRQINMSITSGANLIFRANTGGNIAASAKGKILYAPGSYNSSPDGFNNQVRCIFEMVLIAGDKIRFVDGANVDPNGDEMIINLHVIEIDTV